MNKILNIIILYTLFFTACKQNDTEFEYIFKVNSIEELDALIDNCRSDEFESREIIEENLIGEWRLIAIRSGWVNEFTEEEITLNIDENSIVLNDLVTGEVSETDWNLKFMKSIVMNTSTLKPMKKVLIID